MQGVADTKEFLRELLPLPEDRQHLSSLFDALQQNNHYRDSKWLDLPGEGDSVSEASMYEPLAKLLEVINQQARELYDGAHEDRLNGKWVHLQTPASKSNDPRSKMRKPGVVFMPQTNTTTMVSSPTDKGNQPQGSEDIELARSQNATNPCSCLADEHAKPENDNAVHNTMNNSMKEEQLGKKGPTIWWLHAFAVIEVASKKKASSMARLASYVSQIFTEQLDRMFVFALTLELDQLCVHLYDCSGIVSTCPIDIHKNPMDFLHVIASFTWLTPKKLGWDATFRVWDGERPVPSYRLALESLDDCSSACHLPWVIDGFPPREASTYASASSGSSYARGVDSSSNHQSSVAQYVTIRNLNLRNASGLWSGATMVFEVILLDDWVKKNTKAQIYVLKQSWQRLPAPESDVEVALCNSSQGTQESDEWSEHLDSLRKDLETWPYEAYVLRHAGLDSSRLREAGYVMSEGGKVETLGFIRKGLTLNPAQSKSKEYDGVVWLPDSGSIAFFTLCSTDSQTEEEDISGSPGVAEKPLQLVSRTLTRMVLKLPGPTIKSFSNKLELLNGLLGALNDHEELYKSGIIHRDVSINNIILSPSDSFGHLIDLNHSKVTLRKLPFPHQEEAKGLQPEDWDGQWDDRLNDYIATLFHHEVVELGGRLYGNRYGHYLLAAAEINGRKHAGAGKITLNDLGWNDFYPIPSVERLRAGAGHITGTLAFMSHQLGPHAKLAHTAIHDVESFWWVLVYIVIIVGKPGRPPLKRKEMMKAMLPYFYDPVVSKNEKSELFSSPEYLEVLLAHVDDYFSDLKPLIKQWFEILRFAWWWRRGVEFHYPHRIVRKLLEETIASLPDVATTGEVSWMDKYMQEIKTAISQQKTVHMLAPMQTPTASAQPAPTPFTPALPNPAPPTSVPPAPAIQPPSDPSKTRPRSPPTSPPTRKKSKQN